MVVPGSEPVTVGATPAVGWFDPAEHRLYLDPRLDELLVGTLITVRGEIRRAVLVETWTEGGIVVHLEPGPVYFPDAVELYTVKNDGALDPATGGIAEAEVPVWAGPAVIEAEENSTASDVDVMNRRNELVRYKIKIPIVVADPPQGTRVRVTASRDPRLLLPSRRIEVDRVLAGSHAQERILLAVERQR